MSAPASREGTPSPETAPRRQDFEGLDLFEFVWGALPTWREMALMAVVFVMMTSFGEKRYREVATDCAIGLRSGFATIESRVKLAEQAAAEAGRCALDRRAVLKHLDAAIDGLGLALHGDGEGAPSAESI